MKLILLPDFNPKKMVKTIKKHKPNFLCAVPSLFETLAKSTVLGKKVTEECKVEVVNEDGILISDEELKEQYMNEIAQGLRSKTSYLMKFYGMTEEEALEELQLIQDEENGELFDEEMEEEENIDNLEQEIGGLEEELGAV